MTTSIVVVEYVLWHPGSDWQAAVEHLASRFARVSALDAEAVLRAGALHEQLDMLHAWASDVQVDLDRELGRWFDEHLSMHVRPSPDVTRAVRALARDGAVHGVSALPARVAESIARHAGCFRSFTELHADVRSAVQLEAIAAGVGCDRLVAEAPTPIPEGALLVALN